MQTKGIISEIERYAIKDTRNTHCRIPERSPLKMQMVRQPGNPEIYLPAHVLEDQVHRV